MAVAAASKHTAILTDAGAIYSWGSNDQGQLGYGTSDYASNALPRQVEAMKVCRAMTCLLLFVTSVATSSQEKMGVKYQGNCAHSDNPAHLCCSLVCIGIGLLAHCYDVVSPVLPAQTVFPSFSLVQ